MMAIGAHANDHGRRTDSIPVQSAHPGRKGHLNRTQLIGGSQYAKVSRRQHYLTAHTASPSTTATSVVAMSRVRRGGMRHRGYRPRSITELIRLTETPTRLATDSGE